MRGGPCRRGHSLRVLAALAIIGNLARDLVAGGPPRIGGTPFHAARALRELGVRAEIATKCAPEHRDTLLPKLAALGFPVVWRAARATATFSFRYEDERRLMTIEQVGEPWTPEEIDGWAAPALRRARWVHVGPLARTDFSPAAVTALARGRRVALDGQGLVRPARAGPLALDAEFERTVLEHVSVLKLAEEEAEVVRDAFGRSLGDLGVPELLVTYGGSGSLLSFEGKEHRFDARTVDADPTGAGDAFLAAYVAGRSRGDRPPTAAERATRLVERLLGGR